MIRTLADCEAHRVSQERTQRSRGIGEWVCAGKVWVSAICQKRFGKPAAAEQEGESLAEVKRRGPERLAEASDGTGAVSEDTMV